MPEILNAENFPSFHLLARALFYSRVQQSPKVLLPVTTCKIAKDRVAN